VRSYPDLMDTYFDREPYMQFDSQSNLFVLYAPTSVFDPAEVSSKGFDIYFNTRLYQLLSSFPSKFVGNQGQKNYRIAVNNQNTARHRFLDFPVLMVLQEISTVAIWNPIASIVFCTGLIPILPSNTSPPKLFGDNNTNLVSSGNNSNLTNILTDFEISVTETNQYRPFISYTPQSEYRLIDMNSITNLNKIDRLAFWKTHYGELIPLKLPPGCAAHMKILFRHRRFGEN
jgi:hypothetical protein